MLLLVEKEMMKFVQEVNNVLLEADFQIERKVCVCTSVFVVGYL